MNKDIEKIIKIQNKISDRFHLCVHTDLEKELKWVLFINFRDERDYFSSYNQPILDSNRSSIEELEDYLKKYDNYDNNARFR